MPDSPGEPDRRNGKHRALGMGPRPGQRTTTASTQDQ